MNSTGPPPTRQPRWVSSSATWPKETSSAGRVLAIWSSSSAVASRSKPSFGGISASTSSSQRARGSVPAAAARRVGSSFRLYLRSSFTLWSASRKSSTWTARFSRLFFPYQVSWSGTTADAAITISGVMYPAWVRPIPPSPARSRNHRMGCRAAANSFSSGGSGALTTSIRRRESSK